MNLGYENEDHDGLDYAITHWLPIVLPVCAGLIMFALATLASFFG
jgi:hypothetical protein